MDNEWRSYIGWRDGIDDGGGGGKSWSVPYYSQSNFGFDQGDLTMLFMDMPEVPPQYTPVIVAQASQTKQQNFERTIGVCHPIENRLESRLSAVNSVSPVGAVYTYLKNVEHRKIDDAVYFAARMTLLQAPTHGELGLDEINKSGRYFPADYSYTEEIGDRPRLSASILPERP